MRDVDNGRGRGGIRSDRSRPGLSGASPSCSGSYSCCRYCCGSASPLAGGGAHARFRPLWVSRCLRLSRALFPSPCLATSPPPTPGLLRRSGRCARRRRRHCVKLRGTWDERARAHAGRRSLSATPLPFLLLSPRGMGRGPGARRPSLRAPAALAGHASWDGAGRGRRGWLAVGPPPRAREMYAALGAARVARCGPGGGCGRAERASARRAVRASDKAELAELRCGFWLLWLGAWDRRPSCDPGRRSPHTL